jgi:hypothetical protein
MCAGNGPLVKAGGLVRRSCRRSMGGPRAGEFPRELFRKHGIAMPEVRNSKSRAKDHYDGAGKGREWRINNPCSWFFLFGGLAVAFGWVVSIDLQTVICQVPSVSRAIVAALGFVGYTN